VDKDLVSVPFSCLSIHFKKIPVASFTALQFAVKQVNDVKDANPFILHVHLKCQAGINRRFSPVRKNFFSSFGK